MGRWSSRLSGEHSHTWRSPGPGELPWVPSLCGRRSLGAVAHQTPRHGRTRTGPCGCAVGCAKGLWSWVGGPKLLLPEMSVTQPVGHFPELGTPLFWEWRVAFRGGTVPPRCPQGELDMPLGTVLEVRCLQGQGSALSSSLSGPGCGMGCSFHGAG